MKEAKTSKMYIVMYEHFGGLCFLLLDLTLKSCGILINLSSCPDKNYGCNIAGQPSTKRMAADNTTKICALVVSWSSWLVITNIHRNRLY